MQLTAAPATGGAGTADVHTVQRHVPQRYAVQHRGRRVADDGGRPELPDRRPDGEGVAVLRTEQPLVARFDVGAAAHGHQPAAPTGATDLVVGVPERDQLRPQHRRPSCLRHDPSVTGCARPRQPPPAPCGRLPRAFPVSARCPGSRAHPGPCKTRKRARNPATRGATNGVGWVRLGDWGDGWRSRPCCRPASRRWRARRSAPRTAAGPRARGPGTGTARGGRRPRR